MGFQGELWPFQTPAYERMLERNVLVAYEMGLGKAEWCMTNTLTPTGWTPIGELKVGDRVIGQDGHPTMVEGVYPQGEKELVKVTFQDRTWTRCSWEHLWNVQTTNDRFRRSDHWRTMTTRQLVDEGLSMANGNRRWYIPMVEPVHFDDPGLLPIDPYALGALLGDGSFGLRGVALDTDLWVIKETGLTGPVNGNGKIHHLRVSDREGVFRGHLSALGLLGCRSWEKFVPEQYLRAGVADRRSLLAGLCDTDGSALNTGVVEYCSASEALVDGVVELVQSLGGVARKSGPRVTQYTHKGEKKDGRPSWRVNIKLMECPFRLPRKADLWVAPTKYPPTRAIVSVEPDGRDEAVCIKVANPDGLYVTRSYIVTHNTAITIATLETLFEEEEIVGALIITPAALKYQWKREIDRFTDGALVTVIDGTPTQRGKQYALAHKFEYVIVNYEQVVNDWVEVSKMVRHWGKRWATAIDEATAIKSPRAKRTRYVQRLQSPFRYALSGQPVENRPEEVYSIMRWVDPDVLGHFERFDATFVKRDRWGGVESYRNLPLLHQQLSTAMVRKGRHDPDVYEHLPKVVEEVVTVPFDAPAAALYRHIAADLLEDLSEVVGSSGSFNLEDHYDPQAGSADDAFGAVHGRIMSKQLCLRMLCDHPHLIELSATKFNDPGTLGGAVYAAELMASGSLDKLTKAPKLKTAAALVREVLEADRGNKVVIFSFFKGMLALLQQELSEFSSELFTGDMSAKEKDAAKVRFQTDPKCRVFLSSDAGGYGIDLPQANYLISYDLPWSFGKLDQRNSRIVRLSSTWESVTVINVLMAGSIEERQYEMLGQKSRIASAVVDGKGADTKGGLTLTLDTLTHFLQDSSV